MDLLWICSGFAWICLDLRGFAWTYGDVVVCMDLLWIYMDLYGFAWIYHGFALDLLQIRSGFVPVLLWMSPVFNTPLACEAVPDESMRGVFQNALASTRFPPKIKLDLLVTP